MQASYNVAPTVLRSEYARHIGIRGEWNCGTLHYVPQHKVVVSGQPHSPAALPRGKKHRNPLSRKLGRIRSRYWCFEGFEKKTSLYPTEIGTPDHLARSLVHTLNTVQQQC